MCFRPLALFLLGIPALTLGVLTSPANADGWKAGAATRAITPEEPIWLSGYAARTRPSQGALHDIWAKALALESPEGKRALLITLDLCGIDREFSLDARRAIAERHKLELSDIVLACSHTHSGPVVGTNLLTMYPIDEAQKQRIADYTGWLGETIEAVAAEAFEHLVEADLAFGLGRCSFAVNRRENDQARADELRSELQLKGPVDHDVPVLTVKNANDDALLGIVFGYACHCTVLSLDQISGDYAGYAMIELERDHPGATAFFVAGCGGDQNPLPRRTVELAEGFGRQLATAVNHVLAGPLRPIESPLQTVYREIDLAFAPVPERSKWEADLESANLAVRNRARLMLDRLDSGAGIPTTYPYPIQAWRFGDDLTWILLGGEVVVDYALRVKRNLDGSKTVVSAYCNDVMAYIPSSRVLREGGYEGGGAMVYYAQPGPWAEDVEERVFQALAELLNGLR